MKLFLSLFLFLLFFQLEKVSSQDLDLDITGKTIHHFVKLEEKLKSKVYQTDGDIVLPSGMAMPIMYRRAEKNTPDLIVNYIFNATDSLIHQINYSWDPRNFEKGEASPKLVTFDQQLIKKYNELLTALTAKYGVSESKGELTDLKKIESNTGLTRSDSWITKERVKIELSIILSNHYKYNGTAGGKPLHIINIYAQHERK